jgi:hypothetical protein
MKPMYPVFLMFANESAKSLGKEKESTIANPQKVEKIRKKCNKNGFKTSG